MTILVFAELWYPRSGLKRQFSDFWKLSLLQIFALTANSRYKFLKVSYATFALIVNIFGAHQVQRTFSLNSVLNAVLVFFGQYCVSLRAIISIITKDNRLLDGCFGKLKRFPISLMTSGFNLNAQFGPKNKPKNFTFLKNLLTLYDVINTS